MKPKGLSLAIVCLAAVFALVSAGQLLAQGQSQGHVVVPDSSVEHATDRGVQSRGRLAVEGVRMRERVQQLGGTLEFESSQEGAMVRVAIPIAPESA